ncbi:MAG: Trm112 family protein [Acidimicrobiia bacterium]|nr:Trm112 family protein [Acidimicrobiia bacterium]
MALDPVLLEILVCPEDHGALYHVTDVDVLYNPRLGRVYEIRDGTIPVMLVEEARPATDDEKASWDAAIEDGSLRATSTR